MKKIIIFYFICCFFTCLLPLVVYFKDIDTRDFRYGYYVYMWVNIVIYIPLTTLLVSIYHYFKINRIILSKTLCGIVYTTFPWVIAILYSYVKQTYNIDISIFRLDAMVETFIIENLLIILIGFANLFRKRKLKNIV